MENQLNFEQLLNEIGFTMAEETVELNIKMNIQSPYLNKTQDMKFIFYNLTKATKKIGLRTLDYIFSNFSNLLNNAMYAFACLHKFEFPDYYYEALAYNNDEEYDQKEPVKRTLQDFYDLIRWEDGGIRIQMDCDLVAEGIARYSFIIDTDYDFSDDGFQFIMQLDKMIGLESANDYYRIQNNSFLVGEEKLSQAILEWENNEK